MTAEKNKKEKKETDILVKAVDTLVPEVVKKALLISIGGVLLTEEAVRKILSEMKLSKEIVSLVVQQSNRAKEEIVRAISVEISNLIKKVNIDHEVKKLLQDIKIKIQMEVDLESKKSGDSIMKIRPNIRKKTKKKPVSKT